MKEQQLTSLEHGISEHFGRIIKKFRILHHGWEMDAYGYITNDGDQNRIIVTNHNRPMVVTTAYLDTLIEKYKHEIENTKEAIRLAYNGSN
jgi:hypothetical protein